MRIKPDESYEDWAERVQKFELDQAKKDLAKGMDLNLVMESMAARIQSKLLHPILAEIRSTPTTFDIEASKKAYEEAYLKKNGPKPDHLIED